LAVGQLIHLGHYLSIVGTHLCLAGQQAFQHLFYFVLLHFSAVDSNNPIQWSHFWHQISRVKWLRRVLDW
jgi:hypothetical protein